MLSLFAFLSKVAPEAQLVSDSDLYRDPVDYVTFLHTTQVVQNHQLKHCSVPSHVYSAEQEYSQFIDGMVSVMAKQSSANVLVMSYKETEWFENVYTSFAVTFLKSANWNRVFCRVGVRVFVELLLDYDCYVKRNAIHVLLFGHVTNLPRYSESKFSPAVGGKSAMLFKEASQVTKLNPVPRTANLLLQEMFPTARLKPHCPRKLKSLRKVLIRVVRAHAKCNYIHHINRFCPLVEIDTEKNNFQYATSRKQVVAFIVFVVDHLFPLEAWGSKGNKAEVFSKLAFFINSGRYFPFTSGFFTERVKIKEIEWLGKRVEKMNKQDFEKRVGLFQGFVSWLFRSFVTKLSASFFHITDGSQTPTLYYYRHQTWLKLTRPFMKSYISRFLERITDCSNHFAALDQTEYLHGKLKLLPKKHDFRVVCSPFKGTDNRQRQVYKNYLFDYIKPVREILNQKRYEQKVLRPRCSSVKDLIAGIKEYKQTAQGKEHYFLKFDIKQCYDTLPKSNTLKLIRSFLVNNETYFQRKVFRSVPNGAVNGPKSKVVATTLISDSSHLREINLLERGATKKGETTEMSGLQEADLKRSEDPPVGTFFVDGHITRKLHHDDIMQIFNAHLDNSAVVYNNKCYKRKRGVFQGLHLSAVSCEIFYDHVVNRLFGFLGPDPETLVLRLVDDFLVVSTKRAITEKVYNAIHEGQFEEFPGISVNRVKTTKNFANGESVGVSELEFCGLTINTETLDVVRNHGNESSYNSCSESFKQLYATLFKSFQAKLIDTLLDSKLNSVEVVLQNIELTGRNITLSMAFATTRLARQDFCEGGFEEFVYTLIQYTVEQVRTANRHDPKFVTLPFCHAVEDILRECFSRFREKLR